MTGFTRVIAAGNLTRAPELKELPSGDKVVELRVAVNDRYRNKNGDKVERSNFMDIVVWGRQAELCDEYLDKGSPVLVDGRLQQSRWQTPEGQPRSRLMIRADRIQFLPSRRKTEEQTREEPAAEQGSPGEEEVDF